MVKVMIVDDHAILRDGLRTIFSFEPEITSISEAFSAEDLFEKLKSERDQPDLIILDINLPGMNGVEAIRHIKKHNKRIKILVLTMYNREEYLLKALSQGADGYLLKDAPSDDLIQAIKKTVKGEAILAPGLTRKLIDYHVKQQENEEIGLTNRETEVLICLVEGLSNKEIAERLFISDKTVKIHVSKIFKKLNVKNRTQAIMAAMNQQLVTWPKNEE
ncbi:response regulator transcription factor [Pullulanibacillus sp. KACC 23026]|uniref:response regulator n=1 Tax=Pullulanibacillus sp. KACC 23026 TaxID=3028315 RepID=UPI0023AEE475|nr:response regulator transcription factor [Pullulanibacillus sp. KACC 23026]WEG12795.1 response regulator transcription factor [Pullulanibacillus sp. KACC 23026]